jgi:hypothetical protein
MGMLDWFKSIVTGDKVGVGTGTRRHRGCRRGGRGCGTGRPEFQDRRRRPHEVEGAPGKLHQRHQHRALKVEVVSRDDQCPLGKWIYDQGGEKFGYSETFFDMKVHHAMFHRCAGKVLTAAQAGDSEGATRLLNAGEYVKASERVKMLLARLFVMASEGKEAIDSHVRWKARLRDFIQGKSQEESSRRGRFARRPVHPRQVDLRHRRRAFQQQPGLRGAQVAPRPVPSLRRRGA